MKIKTTDIFSVGDKIRLYIVDSKDKKNYSSQILDILDDDKFIVSGPIHKKKLIFLHKNEEIRVSSVIKNKGTYIFNANVVKREYKKIYKLELEKNSDIKKIQQRNFFRFNISIPATKYYIKKDKHDEKTIVEKCQTKDISGNGLQLYSNYKHNLEDIIICKFNIDEYPIEAKAKIIRINEIDTFDYNYSLGLKFIDLNESVSDRIVKFIFSQQRLLKEKGLI